MVCKTNKYLKTKKKAYLPVRVDRGLVSEIPLSGVGIPLSGVTSLLPIEDTLVNVSSVWFPWLPCFMGVICEGSLGRPLSDSNRPSLTIRSFWATSGDGGGGSMHMQINRINVLIITITSQLRNPQPKINFCDFFFINQNSVLNNDNALYNNALKHVY